jgi:hypothetical protein
VKRSAANDAFSGEPRPGRVPRPITLRAPDRHILLGVSHPSDDPFKHRVFELRAAFDTARGGWVAHVGEQNHNEQRGDWLPLPAGGGEVRVFPTAAACLGDAVAIVIAAFDEDTAAAAETPVER